MKIKMAALAFVLLAPLALLAAYIDQDVTQIGADAADTTITFARGTVALSMKAYTADVPVRVYPFDAAAWTLHQDEAVFLGDFETKPDSVVISRSASTSAQVKIIAFKE